MTLAIKTRSCNAFLFSLSLNENQSIKKKKFSRLLSDKAHVLYFKLLVSLLIYHYGPILNKMSMVVVWLLLLYAIFLFSSVLLRCCLPSFSSHTSTQTKKLFYYLFYLCMTFPPSFFECSLRFYDDYLCIPQLMLSLFFFFCCCDRWRIKIQKTALMNPEEHLHVLVLLPKCQKTSFFFKFSIFRNVSTMLSLLVDELESPWITV